ncbi:hypothetical protein [Kitasatospora sp. NPDC094011]|uniref:hypothetical protein n=1 Tax=Kitasatospora sp. NPDC094011 TaxID=3364090 RepID=UPI00380E9BCC
MTTPIPVRTHLADAVLALVAALALASPATPALAGPAPKAATCGQAVQETRTDLANAGAPSSHTDWQGVRVDAQRYVDDHAWNGSATQKLKGDINDLDRYCAA